MKKTKVVCTMGPNTNDRELLKKLIENGMDVARFNFSHGDHEEQKSRMDLLKELRQELNTNTAILLDTKGPEIRTGVLKGGKRIMLKAGEQFTLTTEEIEGDESKVSITYEGLVQDVDAGRVILIDDGLIELKVVGKSEKEIFCEVINGGELGERKGVNVPNVAVRLPAITEKDKDDIRFGVEQGIDFIAASFVRNAECVLEIKAYLKELGAPYVPIIAKVENAEVLSNVTEAIYGRLLFPNWKSMKGLDRYIKIIGARITQLVDAGRTEYFVANKTKSAIVNTGMMDLFGNDFLVLYRYYEKYKTYIAERVIESKQDYLNYGFTKEQSMMQIEPISFFDEKEEVFNPKKEDFDINQNCLIHIIQERRERFPESIRSQSDSKIAGQIMNALERGIKMQRRDRSFAKASYSGKSGTISWFMPLHIDAPLSEDPELVMVVRRSGDFYEIKTILSYDDELKDRITALSLYSKLW